MIGAIIAKRKAREVFRHFNNRDMQSFFKLWDDNAVFIYPGEVSASGVVMGKTAIEAWFDNLMTAGPFVHFTLTSIAVEDPLDVVGTNVLSVEWENNVTTRDDKKLLVHGVSVIRLVKGKVIHVRDYIFEAEELPVAWCEAGELAQRMTGS